MRDAVPVVLINGVLGRTTTRGSRAPGDGVTELIDVGDVAHVGATESAGLIFTTLMVAATSNVGVVPFPDFAKRHVGNLDFVSRIHVVGEEGDPPFRVSHGRELGGTGRNIPDNSRRRRQIVAGEVVRDALWNGVDVGLLGETIVGLGFFGALRVVAPVPAQAVPADAGTTGRDSGPVGVGRHDRGTVLTCGAAIALARNGDIRLVHPDAPLKRDGAVATAAESVVVVGRHGDGS